MNSLKIVAEKPVPFNNQDPSHGMSMFLKLEVDGMTIAEGPVVDLQALSQSAASSGSYPVLVCSCGDPGCDVVTADVKTTEQTIRWTRLLRNNDSGRPAEVIRSTTLIFDKDAYLTAIEEAKNAIRIQQAQLAPIEVLGPTGPYSY
jgi:hypothetical protein